MRWTATYVLFLGLGVDYQLDLAICSLPQLSDHSVVVDILVTFVVVTDVDSEGVDAGTHWQSAIRV